MSSAIVLSTLNASYFHSAFGLRYLYANLGALQERARLLEFTTDEAPREIAERLLALSPEIVGLGVYVWNTRQTLDVVTILRRVRPELLIILGGPEVSYETESQPLAAIADCVVRGEGDLAFAAICQAYLERKERPARIVAGGLPSLPALRSPYPFYSDEDIRHRVIYVEASRGCPYRCEFCLSSLDEKVRAFDLDCLLADFELLYARGARQFKFVDRTFNLSVPTATRILRFFLARAHDGLFLHFEMVPDRLPPELRDLIRQFPPGSLQFEIGIQTWSPEVARLVSRRQDYGKVRENFSFLRKETTVHLHADLIAGLPGETMESFAVGFDAVAELDPHEIQVGILKRLKGTPITRHDKEWAMVYDAAPPFPILSTKTMAFERLQELGRFAKFWDLYANRGNFPHLMRLLRAAAARRSPPSLFAEFLAFTRFLAPRHRKLHSIALLSLVESAWHYLREHPLVEAAAAREALLLDYTGGTVKRDVPPFLRDGTETRPVAARGDRKGVIPPRQQRHLAGIPIA